MSLRGLIKRIGVVRKPIEKLIEKKESLSLRCLKLLAKVPLGESIYYGMIRSSYRDEQLAMALGRLEYKRKVDGGGDPAPRLRRNIHRIEKGLCMRPQRIPFGLSYIEDTVRDFTIVMAGGSQSASEVRWYVDVLREYFERHSTVSKSSLIALNTEFELEINQAGGNIPTHEMELPNGRQGHVKPQARGASDLGLKYSELRSLAQQRRSVRWFLDKNVERSDIDEAVKVAALAPTACNRMPYRFIVFEGFERTAKVAALAGGTSGYSEQIPALVVVVGDQSNYFHERDRHLIYIDGSLASMSLILALESKGISSCCINWPEVRHRNSSIKRLVPSLRQYERVVMLIAVGYADPDGLVPASAKKTVDSIREYNPILEGK